MGLFLSMGVPHWRSILQLGANKGLVGHFSNSGGLSFNVVLNETKSFICGGSNSVHMHIRTQVTGDIHPQVPGTADSLQDLPMKYILCVDWGPGGSNPYDLALGDKEKSKTRSSINNK